eukprot:2220573-Amphidinium_carterae.1
MLRLSLQFLLALTLLHEGLAFDLSLGRFHFCALSSPDGLKCWGYNGKGQLGYGDTATRLPDIVGVLFPTVDVGN